MLTRLRTSASSGLAVGGVGADVDDDRPGGLAGELGRDRHLPTRVGPERQVPPDDRERGGGGHRSRGGSIGPGRRRTDEAAQRQRSGPGGGPLQRGLAEEPRLFFLHYWANADAVELAGGLRRALDRMNLKRAI